jgi:hypothetical protein
MEHKVTFKNKAESNAITTYSNTKRNILRGLSFAIALLHSAYRINLPMERDHFSKQGLHMNGKGKD